MTSPRVVASIRRNIASALRARCVSTCPTLQAGNSDGSRTTTSVRPAILAASRAWEARHPSISTVSISTTRQATTLTLFAGRCPRGAGPGHSRSLAPSVRSLALDAPDLKLGASAARLHGVSAHAETEYVATLEALAQMGDAHTNPREWNRLVARNHEASLALRSSTKGRALVEQQLTHLSPVARCWAASHVLLWNEALARPVLDALARDEGVSGLNAAQTLRAFDAGTLTNDW